MALRTSAHPGLHAPCHFRLLGLLLVFAGVVLPGLVAQPLPPALRSIAQIRTLSLEAAHAGHPVHLRGTVLVLSGWHGSFFVSDGQFGISVDRDDPMPDVRAGDTVLIDGVTGEGKFAPVIRANHISITGHRPLPPAPRVAYSDMRNGRLDGQWVSVQGIVRSAQILPHNGVPRLLLSIDVGLDNIIGVRFLTFSPDAPALLEGSTIRLRAVCASAFNTRRQFIGPLLYAMGMADIHMEHTPAPQPFAAPIVPLANLLRFNGDAAPAERVHVQGTVTCIRSSGFCLQQGSDGIFVETDRTAPVAVGTSIEVVGYQKGGTYSPTLTNAIVRPSSLPSRLHIPDVSSSSLLAPLDAYITAPFDGLLIRLSGKLLQTLPGTDENILLIDSGGVLISVRLPLQNGIHPDLPQPGAILALTGVSSTVTNDLHEAHASTLLLRSMADLQVLHAAPWWTGARAWWVIVALCLLILLLLAWTVFMRRQAKLHDLVARDPLTGLYNRRGFLLMAERQWHQALRHNQNMLLFYVDLDRFKSINDNYGHKAGDLTLQAVATLLRDCFRKSDIVGRLGGDEFAIAALDTPDLPSETIRKRLQQTLAVANADGAFPFQIALSIGVLSCDRSLAASPIEDLMERADALMYRQKQAHHDILSAAAETDRVHLSGTGLQGMASAGTLWPLTMEDLHPHA